MADCIEVLDETRKTYMVQLEAAVGAAAFRVDDVIKWARAYDTADIAHARAYVADAMLAAREKPND